MKLKTKILMSAFLLLLTANISFAAEQVDPFSKIIIWLNEMGHPPNQTADGQGLTFKHKFIINPFNDDRYVCIFIANGPDKISLVSLWDKSIPKEELSRVKKFIKLLNTIVQTGYFEMDDNEKRIGFVNSLQFQSDKTTKEDLFMMMSDNLHGFDYLIDAFKEVLKGAPPNKVVVDVKRKSYMEEKQPEVDRNQTVG